MSDTVMLVMVDTSDNNNKFYELSTLPDGRVQARYGRIGATEQIRVYPPGSFNSKLREKTRKGYTVRDSGAPVTNSTLTVDAADRVAKALFNGSTDSDSLAFAKVLLHNNRHAISDATGGKITVNRTSGAVETALGPVTPTQLIEARAALSTLKSGSMDRKVIEKYLTLIPQRISNVRTTSWITPSWFVSQDDLLDALEAALASTAAQQSDADAALPPIPFRNRLELLLPSDPDFIDIEKRFQSSANTKHTMSASRKLKRVWRIEDVERGQWDTSKELLKHSRSLWHGTTAGNVLSILRTGLVCPPMSDGRFATTGRMFGDGVYFSDQSTKSLNYAVGAWNRNVGSGNPMMFLADVVMGREYRPTTHHNVAREARTGKDYKGRPYNSIFVRGGTCNVLNNEMIVWNTEQITLTHLCEFN